MQTWDQFHDETPDLSGNPQSQDARVIELPCNLIGMMSSKIDILRHWWWSGRGMLPSEHGILVVDDASSCVVRGGDELQGCHAKRHPSACIFSMGQPLSHNRHIRPP
jgi:hypothetical protein